MKKEIIQKCPICVSSSMVVDVVPTINLNENDEVELRCCDSCGHWWHNPMPNQKELNEMYQSASPFVVSAGAKEIYKNKNSLDSFQKYVLKSIKKKTGNYLEIGAGGGALLRRFRAKDYTCYGVDPAQWVKDRSIVKSIDDLPKDLQYDVFVLQDVLEHVFDPVGLMVELKDRAAYGSIFFCSVPCKDSRPARAYKGKWAMVRPYGHLHYFSFDSAKKLFSLAGLTINDMGLKRVTAISKTLRCLNIRELLWEILKGGKDQIYAQVTFQRI